jgi:D-glycero-D-manno-heptose 1,7-bisphosphate phosphatase
MPSVSHRESRYTAVFLDRDGTLNPDPGYIDSPDKIVPYSYSAHAIRRLSEAGHMVVIVSNQSGIARGYFNEETLAEINARLIRLLECEGGRVHGLYYCPHYPETTGSESEYLRECECRKPKPGLLLQAAADLDIDLKRSVVIGDRYLDIELAHAVGATGILVLTGWGKREFESERANWPRMPDLVTEDLMSAVDAVLSSTAEATP